MKTKQRARTMKGWAFDRTVSVGMGRIRCTPFFRYESQAQQTAERFAYEGVPGVVRAALTIDQPKQKKPVRKKGTAVK